MIPGMRADLEARSEADQEQFFHDVMARARQAEEATETVVRDIQIAGQRIRLVYAGDALDRVMTPALAHLLVAPDAAPDLVLHVWDTESTGVELCQPPVEPHCFSDRGDIWTFESERWRSAFPMGDFSLNLLDMQSGEGVFWARAANAIPFWTVAAPYRALINWWLSAHGAQLVHGAVVGNDDGGVLIVGKGGVGKSTTALACLSAGLRYLGDDYVVIGGDETPVAFSLYQTAKLDPVAAKRFAWLAPRLPDRVATGQAGKAVMHVRDQRPDLLVASLPLRAVLTPKFSSSEASGTRRIAPESVIGPALYTTMAQLPHAGPLTLALIERQIRRLPCFQLDLGTDVDRVPDAIVKLLADPAARDTDFAVAARPRPLVSVVIPVYKGLEFLPAAIDSILAQHYPALEIIVVDDGGGPAIRAAVEKLPIEVRLLPKRNGGAADARNAGIRAASGDLIAFLDVDDLWAPGKLAAAVDWLEDHPDTDVVTGGAQVFRQASRDAPISFVGSPLEAYLYYIGAGLFRRRAFERVGMFDARLRLGEDTDWFARAAEHGLVVDRMEATVLMVRRHAENTTAAKTVPELIPLQLVRNALTRKRGVD